jgi:outer membrane protein assembly factor BamE (lipoprotein component of BamABCDE complex)
MSRIGWLLAALALAGCAEFNTTVSKPELLPAYDEQRATIEAGKTTRAEVRELLGEPWLASESWGFELYTFSDRRRDVWWLMAPLLPVPVGASKREVTAYTLVTWNEDGTVGAFSSGTVVNGAVGEYSMLIRSDHLTLAVQADSQPPAIILWADPGRLESFLEARRESTTCTLVAGCDAGESCPDMVVGFDDYPPLIRTPRFSTWFALDRCRGHHDCISTLAYPFDLAPENHRLQLRTGYPLCDGQADIEFSCAPGQVLFARLRADELRQRRDCKMTLTAEFVDQLPPEWSGRGVVLWRNGNWIAAN